MDARNGGRRFQIYVNGKKRSAYWNGHTVGWYIGQEWIQYPEMTLDGARDRLRNHWKGE